MEHHKPNFFPHTVIEIQNDELKLKEDGSNIQNNVGQNGNILANQYELVRNILRHLSMRDLLRCCKVVITIIGFDISLTYQIIYFFPLKVCRLWRDIGSLVKKEKQMYNSESFFWSAERADVSYYSQYPLFHSPHHQQVW